MRKLFWMMALMASMTMTANAETLPEVEETQATQEKATVEVPAWVKNIKFSGYGMLQYQGQDKEGDHTNTFNLRLARFILDGKIGDFDWRAQIQGTNAKGPGEPTVQLVDLYAEWRKYPEFKIRAGQFKRAFTFENPTHPITQGWRGYADVINNLSGFGDRTGEKSSGGRDLGIQVAGDILPNASGRKLLHYQVGIYNGEGINMKDKDNKKDIIGGMWVMPIKGLRIGAFGWTGTRGEMATTYVDPILGRQTITLKSVRKNRYCLSAEYDKDEYTFRAEYIHNQGWGSNLEYGDKADGWYAFGIVPLIKGKLHAKARYQTYRVAKEWNSSVNQVECGLNYFFTKNLEMHVEYSHVNDRKLAEGKHNYNLVDVELDFRF
ncbi:porin [Prevotella sp. P6B4]|uniref:porin n=1 Tax=Prevotella sp. P6B4 TaxID=1410614 RepID=UPI00048D9525|nr:porin [Prevotella sp. P6B4]